MLKRSGFLLLLVLFLCGAAHGQISAKLMRYMDVSDSQIAFVYGGDIWIMPKTGGTAIQVTHSPGEESWPRFSPDGKSIAYSGDTEPAQSLVELARGVDLLLHEATGEGPGHSSPAQAGDVARQAGVGRLVLVHYPPQPDLFDIWLEQAQSSFDGPVELGRDMQVLNL